MSVVSSPAVGTQSSALKVISIGGVSAGIIDLLHACILFGWDIPLAIAAGVLGKQAFQGGAGTYALGVLLHFFIALSAADDLLLRQPPPGIPRDKLAGLRTFLRHGR